MKAYQKAGVDLAAADEAVERLKPLAQRTLRPEVLSGLGGFGGLFELNRSKYKNPVLVSGTDGVGTKLKLAFELDSHETIGIALVAMCVNDISSGCGATVFFGLFGLREVVSAKGRSGGERYQRGLSAVRMCLTGRRNRGNAGNVQNS